MDIKFKKHLLDYCHSYVNDRIGRIRSEIAAAQQAANEETKSSAGDKHETARAMAQLEVEMNAKQLDEAEKLQHLLNKIDIESPDSPIGLGSLVRTDQGLFFLGISIGKITVSGTDCFIVSPDSPVGKLLLQRKPGDSLTFNGRVTTILEIG
jgi:transcription elongation GreA/GreB family factor